jgi:transmembrane sensor
MSYEKAKALLFKYKNDECTDAEKALVEKWLFAYGNNEFDLSDDKMDEISQEIWSSLPKPAFKVIKGTIWLRIASAAVILLFLSVGLYFIIGKPSQQHFAVKYTRDITPGGNKAILTLTNGKKIILNDIGVGKVAAQGTATINKTANGEVIYSVGNTSDEDGKISFNTISTPRGGLYHLVLSDGTGVWLNASSSIKYPAVFTGNERSVEITGEAYFEVTHNAAKPFRVTALGQTIEDLGTQFNVNAYPDESLTETTLLTGSVKITKGTEMTILTPGEQARVKSGINNTEISVLDHADTDEAMAWKNGFFQFNKATIESVMRQVGRWYNVDISYAGGKIPVGTFTGNISRNSNASQLLEILSYSGVHFEINGRKIIVTTE